MIQCSFRFLQILAHCIRRSTTLRRGCLGAGRLGTADYAPRLLGVWTFMRRDF